MRVRANAGVSGRPILVAALLAVTAVVAVGCGSSNSTTTSATTAAAAPATSTPASTTEATTTSTAAPAASGLSGTWSGQYSGAYQGTFVLKWVQTGSTLSGTIKLSTPPATLNINGALSGSTIRFGTVGSLAITYTGSVSGNSMQGSYQVAGSTGGSWSATKTS